MTREPGRHYLEGFLDIPRSWPAAPKRAVYFAAGVLHTTLVQV